MTLTKEEIELIIEQAQAKAFQGYANVFRGDTADCVADMNANAAMIASARLLEATAPKWYKPEKGELPEEYLHVWFANNGGNYRMRGYLTKRGRWPYFYDLDNEDTYKPDAIRCWTYVQIPDLPPQ